jgi:DNA-binding NarL/FixJ family response regulator
MTLPSVTIEKAKERIFSQEAPLGIRRSALLLFDIETRKLNRTDAALVNVLEWMNDCLERQKRANNILTPLELKLLQMLVDGFTQKKIAEELDRNERNTKRHFANVRKKLSVKTTLQAVALCVRYRWVDTDQLGN